MLRVALPLPPLVKATKHPPLAKKFFLAWKTLTKKGASVRKRALINAF
jgi:hypothetical protein